ncbi:glycosyltransferase family 9 protein [Candidatus Omnitrophota bacterium]
MSKRILIVNPFGIGDVLFTTPLVRALKDNLPGVSIGYWCNERVSGLLGCNTRIDRIFALSRGDLKKKPALSAAKSFLALVSALKKEKFDTAFDFSLDHRYGLLTKLIGVKRRIGYNYRNRGRFLTEKIDLEGYADKHIIEYYLDLLKITDIIAQDRRMELSVPQDFKSKAKDLLLPARSKSGRLVGILPGAGASWGRDAHFKHWPAAKFGQLADCLIKESGAQVVLLGDQSEKQIGEVLIKSSQSEVLNLIGRTSIGELTAVINELDLLITNDGGPLHIAVALGKKTISFFGPVDAKVYGPYPADTGRHIVLKKGLDCSPCYTKFRLRECLRDRECLEGITVGEASEAARRLS